MKKLRVLWAGLLTALFLLILPVSVSAAPASATLTGPASVRAGDTIAVTLSLSGTGVEAVSGSLQYDSAQLTLKSVKQTIASPWMLETNGNYFMVYDNNLSAPINKGTSLFTATFTVNSKLAAGTAIKVSATGMSASDGAADLAVNNPTYSATVQAPLSGNCNLASLSVSGLTLSPKFSASTLNYSGGTVPFSTSTLTVSAKAEDEKAKVAVSGTNLVVGKNTVVITVTAPNGAKKTYAIAVTREQDPNYVKSNNSTLSGIKVEGYVLSPVFTPENTEYVVWLPYETEQIKVTATAASAKSLGVKVSGGSALEAGKDNPVTIVCTAEDGSTTTYTVVAKRAAAHDAVSSEPEVPSKPVSSVPEVSSNPESVPSVPSEPEVPSTPSEPEEWPGESEEKPFWLELVEKNQNTVFFWGFLGGILLLFLLFGMLIGYAIRDRRKEKKTARNEMPEPEKPERDVPPVAPTPVVPEKKVEKPVEKPIEESEEEEEDFRIVFPAATAQKPAEVPEKKAEVAPMPEPVKEPPEPDVLLHELGINLDDIPMEIEDSELTDLLEENETKKGTNNDGMD